MGARSGRHDGAVFRQGYPDHEADDQEATANLDFYRGERQCLPNRLTIDELHEQWWGAYDVLEMEHGYIQWLFPIREDGMNHHAQQLMIHERDAIRGDPECQARMVKSYSLFLDFMGFTLTEDTGEIARADHHRARFHNLKTHSHNFLRITRVLKALAEFGFERYQAPLIRALAKEVFDTQELAPCADSLANWWVHVILDDDVRDEMIQLCCENGHEPISDDDGARAAGVPQ